MKALAIVKSLGPIDANSIRRDAMLRWMAVLPLVVALAVRWVLPPIVFRLDQWLPINVESVYPDLMGYTFLLLVPYFWGAIIGFLLLDQRDDRTLLALQVTPLSLRGYLAYRLTMPVFFSIVMTFIAFPLTGLARIPPGPLLLLALCASPQASLGALALAALAQNKVQGLALMKAAGVVLVPPLVAYFVPAGWDWLLALIPTYWPARMFWAVQAGEHTYPVYLFLGLLYQFLLLGLLVRRFEKIMHR